MANRPTIALLIPAYNAAKYLPRLLESAQRQSEPFDHIWVYDDCSTDDTSQVAERLGAKVLKGMSNKGCSAGKNALARHVECDWIHFHDADDELMPNFVALGRKWIANSPPDVVLFNYDYVDDNDKTLLSRRRFDPTALRTDARRYAIREQINPFCGLYRRSAYLKAGGYDEDPAILYNEDVAFHIKLAFAGISFDAESEVSIINYRVGGSMSGANQVKCLLAHLEVMKRTLARSDSLPYRMDIAERLWSVAGSLGAHGMWAEADEAATIARGLGLPPASSGSAVFRSLARYAPHLALRLRETWIRRAKPELRSKS